MDDHLPPRCLRLGLASLGFFAAWPIFLFVGGGQGLRLSMTDVGWRECWLGLQPWNGIPIPLILPVLLGSCLFAFSWRSRLLTGGLCTFAALLLAVVGISRGLQFIIPLLWLASVPRCRSSSWIPYLLRGWLIGGLAFVFAQLSSVAMATGSPLMLAHAGQVLEASGDWGVAESTRIWGLCVYQALISVPDLLIGIATFSALKALTVIPVHPRQGLCWGAAWFASLIAAFNSGRSSIILILICQLLAALVIILVGRCSPLLLLLPGLPLFLMTISWAVSFKPVVLDRFLFKFSSSQVFDRLPIWEKASGVIVHSPQILIQGTVKSVPGTHSLLGDLVMSAGLPLALVYIIFLLTLARVAWVSCSAQSTAWAKAGLTLLLIVPVVQNLINANLFQPFGFGNFLLTALAIVSFV